MKLQEESLQVRQGSWDSNSSQSMLQTPQKNGKLYPDCIHSEKGQQLSPLGRHQVMLKIFYLKC